MQRPRKAIILAAGHATRMRPLSDDLPKPLMPLRNRPLLARSIDLLTSWGVRDILINLHHGADEVLTYIRSESWPARISFSFEPEIRGTGGALRQAAWFLDDQPVWMLNADLDAQLSPRRLVSAFNRPRVMAALWMDSAHGPRTVDLKRGYVQNFVTATPGGPRTHTFCGLHLISPRILEYLPDEPFSSIITAYESAMRDGWRIPGVSVPRSIWADLGTPASYLQAHHSRRSGGFRFVAADAHVPSSARLRRVVLWSGARVAAHARLSNVIVGRDCTVGSCSDCVAVRADRSNELAIRQSLDFTGWPARRTTVYVIDRPGSMRKFFRLERGRERVMAVHYDPRRLENIDASGHMRLLKMAGVSVPEVLRDNPEENIFIMTDLGDQTLLNVTRQQRPAHVRKVYEQVLSQALIMHGKGATVAAARRHPMSEPCTPALYAREHESFITHFVSPILGLKAKQLDALRAELAHVASGLPGASKSLIHRDLQSTNVLIHRSRPYLIDTQGMRLGSPAYDLVALLYDPYVRLTQATRDHLLDYYLARAPRSDSIAQAMPWAIIQRLTQAIGAYARLSGMPGFEHYQIYIRPAARRIARTLRHHPELRALDQLFQHSYFNLRDIL
ncbi:MAG: sugar phosphate nucleotidyltransferase [Verrucomicrobia bacterium]|nr:sugar phosphate nucleotidyltransferase [Verrucomicrobiota bacterium]MDA1088600.1 sugar phosphate nucleotidyltransferase [Verrucomicrobiota bacterium]